MPLLMWPGKESETKKQKEEIFRFDFVLYVAFILLFLFWFVFKWIFAFADIVCFFSSLENVHERMNDQRKSKNGLYCTACHCRCCCIHRCHTLNVSTFSLVDFFSFSFIFFSFFPVLEFFFHVYLVVNFVSLGYWAEHGNLPKKVCAFNACASRAQTKQTTKYFSVYFFFFFPNSIVVSFLTDAISVYSNHRLLLLMFLLLIVENCMHFVALLARNDRLRWPRRMKEDYLLKNGIWSGAATGKAHKTNKTTKKKKKTIEDLEIEKFAFTKAQKCT